MELTGKLVQVQPEVSGEGKNGRWVKCDFIIETQDKFPKKVCITAWSDLVETIKATNPGTELKVSFDISSREYNTKWYTDVKAWKIEGANGGSSSGGNSYSRTEKSSDYNQERPENAVEVREDDLPF
jgi:hypothetical protein